MRWVILFTRGMIYDQHMRRLTMFYTVLVALVMAFGGDMFLSDWLRRPWQLFVIYWLVCGWLTVLAALLAIYDLLLLRVQHRLVHRQLHKKILGETVEKNRAAAREDGER